MPPLLIAGLALAAAKVVKGVVDKNKASKIDAQFQPYQKSEAAQNQLDTARQMFNGRMAGAATEERNIDTSQAAYNDFLDRNTTNGAQKLALAAAGQSRANQAYSDLAVKEQQNKYGLLANMNHAYANMIREDDKVYQSKLYKYSMDTNQKRALNESGDQNIFGGISDGIGMMGMMSAPQRGIDDPQVSLRSNQAYTSLQPSMPAISAGGSYPSYQGPGNVFGTPPAYGSMQLWRAPLKLS